MATPPRRRSPANASPTAEAPGVPARRAALRMLDGVLNRGEPLDRLAPGATRGLAPADAALAVAIAAETLRWKVDLDALIDRAAATPPPADAKVRHVVGLALVQALRLETPPHAVVATALPLLTGGPRRLAHGLIGRVLREGWTLPPAPTLPAPVAARWQDAWGPAMVAGAAAALAAPPPLDLSLAADPPPVDADPGGSALAPRHRRLARGGAVAERTGFAAGGWWVQDLAASVPARLIGPPPVPGARVLDLCAAPGGKTMQLAAAGWAVTALDISARRAERLAANLARTGLAAEVVRGDALAWRPPGDDPFDAVLLDAPCSATGIFRRHPDVLHRVDAAQIATLGELQGRLLAHAATLVRPGGRLVYATCSLEPEEGEDQLAPFLAARPGWRLLPATADELPDDLPIRPDGTVRLAPPLLAAAGGLDGFFIARLAAPG